MKKKYFHSNVITRKTSPTISAILAYIYRKDYLLSQCGEYANAVLQNLELLGIVRKVTSSKGIFFFKTKQSENFKAIDFAKEYLWNFHNTEFREIIDGKKFIFCFDKDIETGQGLVEIEEAIQKCYI